MIDIIGFIKVDESKPERINQLIACIRSYKFLAGAGVHDMEPATITIAMDKPSVELVNMVSKEVDDLGFVKELSTVISVSFNKVVQYGKIYKQLIEKYSKNDFVINFMEDQFMVIDSKADLAIIVSRMGELKVDVCRSSFYAIENKCMDHFISTNKVRTVAYHNSEALHNIYQEPYKKRYWLGVNFITTKTYALKFWDRDCGAKPHDYELVNYDESLKHIVMVPPVEIQAAVDDDHDEPGTCLLQRNDAKFNSLYSTVSEKTRFTDTVNLAQPLEIEYKDGMMIAEEARRYIRQYITDYKNDYRGTGVLGRKLKVLEFGMGRNTTWLSRHKDIEQLVSIEPNQKTFDAVTSEIQKTEHFPSTYFGLHKPPFESTFSTYTDEYFDIVFIECIRCNLAIFYSIQKLKPGGILVLNNSVHANNAPGILATKSWNVCHFQQKQQGWHGDHPFFTGWQTSIFIKPKNNN